MTEPRRKTIRFLAYAGIWAVDTLQIGMAWGTAAFAVFFLFTVAYETRKNGKWEL